MNGHDKQIQQERVRDDDGGHPPPLRSEHHGQGRRDEDSSNRGPLPRRDRSLSPYSKRLALTEAMNRGQ